MDVVKYGVLMSEKGYLISSYVIYQQYFIFYSLFAWININLYVKTNQTQNILSNFNPK